MQTWSAVNAALRESIANGEEAEILGEGIVLIPSENGLPSIGAAISAAESHGWSYRVLFIENATEWKRDLK